MELSGTRVAARPTPRRTKRGFFVSKEVWAGEQSIWRRGLVLIWIVAPCSICGVVRPGIDLTRAIAASSPVHHVEKCWHKGG